MPNDNPTIWALVDDRAGNAAQTLGVCEALGRPFVVKSLSYSPFAKVHSSLLGASLMGVSRAGRDTLQGPWPDLVIAAGRRTVPVARWIKRQSKAVAVQLMNPGRMTARAFDLVAIPRHDAVTFGDQENILLTTGAPHRVTPERLAAARALWSERLASLPRPFVALLTGGATHSRPFPPDRAVDLARAAARMASGGSVLVATSRRTGQAAEEALLAHVPEPRNVFLWSAGGENPFLGFLSLADAVIVTGDSVSMCSEACATEGPVYIDAPFGSASGKHLRLHQELYDKGFARPLPPEAGTFEAWRHPALNAARDVARAIERHLAARGWSKSEGKDG